MTIEQLEKANKIHKELKEKQDFLKAFNSPYSNCIRAKDYDGNMDATKSLILENDENLSDLIRGYISDRITELEKRLEKL